MCAMIVGHCPLQLRIVIDLLLQALYQAPGLITVDAIDQFGVN
jgi:hypothetical protein